MLYFDADDFIKNDSRRIIKCESTNKYRKGKIRCKRKN